MRLPRACSCPLTFSAPPSSTAESEMNRTPGVVRDVEEVARAEVPVASGVAGLQAVGVDRELYGRVAGQIERAVIAIKVALDRDQPPQVRRPELNARAGRSSRHTPSAKSSAPGADGVGVVLIKSPSLNVRRLVPGC